MLKESPRLHLRLVLRLHHRACHPLLQLLPARTALRTLFFITKFAFLVLLQRRLHLLRLLAAPNRHGLPLALRVRRTILQRPVDRAILLLPVLFLRGVVLLEGVLRASYRFLGGA